jgi:hypothetical protein
MFLLIVACMHSSAAKALVICLPVFILLLGVAAWNPKENFWGGVEPPKAQCEAYDTTAVKTSARLSPAIYSPVKINRLLREPQNTLSNLPYAVVGLAVFLAGRRRLSQAFGISCVFLSIGSGLYHASLLPEWRLVDILGVYVALFVLVAIGVDALSGKTRNEGRELICGSVVWLAAFATGIHRNDIRFFGVKLFDSTYVVVIAVTLASLLALFTYLKTKDYRRYYLALASLAIAAPIAIAGGLGDRFGGFLASPDALIQGHSVWHSFGALGLLAAYEIFASTGYDRSVFDRRPARI